MNRLSIRFNEDSKVTFFGHPVYFTSLVYIRDLLMSHVLYAMYTRRPICLEDE